jgi:hypothetical protein
MALREPFAPLHPRSSGGHITTELPICLDRDEGTQKASAHRYHGGLLVPVRRQPMILRRQTIAKLIGSPK